MSDKQLNILCFGAHPDDCDLRFRGAAMKYRALGHRVRFVSMTNIAPSQFPPDDGPTAQTGVCTRRRRRIGRRRGR